MPNSIPRSASDFIIPGEPFIVADILSELGERTIIFASRRNLNDLSQSSSLYFDSTFKTISEIFY
ncbi:hypothetical protein HZS_8077 [Henneguya salminicola]|nr:hypothetical protein HZS_8077 [Henneguya salminicola]